MELFLQSPTALFSSWRSKSSSYSYVAEIYKALLLPVDVLLIPVSQRRGIPKPSSWWCFPSCLFCIDKGDCHFSLWSLLQGTLCLISIADFSKQLKDPVFSRSVYMTMHRKRISFLINCFLSLSPEENLKAVMIFKVGDPTGLLMQGLQQKKCLN